jgi:hypothetical protein
MEEQPTARVIETEDGIVLVDPQASAIIRAIGKLNCVQTFAENADRIEHFERRITELGQTAAVLVIVVVAVDDPLGRPLADALMPGHDWQAFRDRGEIPFARGLAARDGIEAVLEGYDKEAADKLRGIAGVAVVVVDHGVVEIFERSAAP